MLAPTLAQAAHIAGWSSRGGHHPDQRTRAGQGFGWSTADIRRLPTELVGQLKPHRPTSLLLPNSRAVHRVAAWRYIVDTNGYHVAATQLAVDGEIEQREIPLATLHLQLGSDRPDMTGPQRRLSANELALVPWCATSGLSTIELGWSSMVCSLFERQSSVYPPCPKQLISRPLSDQIFPRLVTASRF